MTMIDVVALVIILAFIVKDYFCGLLLSTLSIIGLVACYCAVAFAAVPLGKSLARILEFSRLQGIGLAATLMVLIIIFLMSALKFAFKKRLKVQYENDASLEPSTINRLCAALVGAGVGIVIVSMICWSWSLLDAGGVFEDSDYSKEIKSSLVNKYSKRVVQKGLYLGMRAQSFTERKAKAVSYILAAPSTGFKRLKSLYEDPNIKALIYDKNFIRILSTGDRELIRKYPPYAGTIANPVSLEKIKALRLVKTGENKKEFKENLTKDLANFGDELARVRRLPNIKKLTSELERDGLLKPDAIKKLVADERFLKIVERFILYRKKI